jgi:tetratricopeptide (TPR) repeat protein
MTPYGTPVPSAGSGGIPGGYAPDPFAAGAPPTTAPPPPPRPAMSSDTRNFLGIFLLTLGVAGMVLFAIWAVGLAYRSYETAQTIGAASRYYEQGRQLHEQGKLDLAEQQYQNAIRVSPKSNAAASAREGLYKVWIARAYIYSQTSDKTQLLELGRKMIEADANKPEGHYYLGLAHELSRKYSEAADEYRRTSDLAGNDQAGYGPAARARLDQVEELQRRAEEGAPDTGSSSPGEPQPQPRTSPIPYEGGTQTEGQ